MAFTLNVAARTTAKAGNTEAMNEDAIVLASKLLRVAIADGASESWQAGAWAKTLATAYAKSPPDPATFSDWLLAVREQAPKSSSQSWYAESKQQDGSFSTLLGLTFEPAKNGSLKWRSLAVGDSCLFHVRNGKLLQRFPLESSSEFSNRPLLIGSPASGSIPEPEWFAGRAELWDVFYLLTDAVAEWCLRSWEANAEPWSALERVTTSQKTQNDFLAWVESLRETKTLRNDDSTVVRVQLAADD